MEKNVFFFFFLVFSLVKNVFPAKIYAAEEKINYADTSEHEKMEKYTATKREHRVKSRLFALQQEL